MRTLAVHPDAQEPMLQEVVQLAGWAGSGGEAKHLIQAGDVLVNGVAEKRRSHRLRVGDRIACGGDEAVLVSDGH